MKTKILGLLAVGLLALPIGANAVSLTVQGGAGVDPNNLVVGQQFEILWKIVGGAANEFDAGSGGGGFSPPAFVSFISVNFGPGFGAASWDSLPTLYVAVFTATQIGTGSIAGSTCLKSNLQDYGCNVSWAPFSITVKDRAVPEPGTLALLGLGLAGLGLSRRRKAN